MNSARYCAPLSKWVAERVRHGAPSDWPGDVRQEGLPNDCLHSLHALEHHSFEGLGCEVVRRHPPGFRAEHHFVERGQRHQRRSGVYRIAGDTVGSIA